MNANVNIFILLAWRYLCGLSLIDLILFAIFVDKIWVSLVNLKSNNKKFKYISCPLFQGVRQILGENRMDSSRWTCDSHRNSYKPSKTFLSTSII